MAASTIEMNRGLAEGIISALEDMHGQWDIRLQGIRWNLIGTRFGMELNGSITVAMHLRELDPREKRAHVDRTITQLKT